MKEMLEANVPIHFLTSCKQLPDKETASERRELQRVYGATIVY